MQKFELDFLELSDGVCEKSIDRIPVKGNENRMVRVAFDLFRLDGNNREDLWVVQADDDGNEFLMRTYNLPDEEDLIQKSSEWEVLLDKTGQNLTIAYKEIPVKRIAASEYNVKGKDEALLLREVILNKIASDESFQNLLLGNPLDKKPCPCGGPHGPGPLGIDSPMDIGMPPQMDGIILFVEEGNKGKKEETKKDKKEKEDSPSEDYTDADNWWENLSDEDKEELFKKFEDAPSITKEQAYKIVNMELKLAKLYK